MMWWWGGDDMGAAGWVGMALMILLWIAIIVGVVYLIRYLARPEQRHEPDDRERGSSDALRTLEERYARGEIDREEFLQRRDDLHPRGR